MATHDVDFEALRRLSVQERLQLIGDLWDTVADEAPEQAVPLTPELAAELDRRLVEYEANPTESIPWGQVREQILRKNR